MARLKKGNEYFDLDEFEPFLKLGSNDIGDISKRSASYSVNFKLPWTARNKTLLNNIGEPNVNGIGASGKVSNVFIEFNSVTYKGFLRVVKSSPNQYYEVYFATAVSDWNDELKGKNLQDLSLSRYDHKYNKNNIINSFNNTDGYIYPFLNYGFWTEYFQAYDGRSANSYETKYNEYFPALFSTTLLKQCLNDIGWNLDLESGLLKEPRFLNEVVLFSEGKFEYKKQDVAKTQVKVRDELPGNPPQPFGVTPTKVALKLNNVLYENKNAHLWDDATSTYTAPFEGAYVFGNLWVGNEAGSTITNMHIFVNNTEQVSYTADTNVGGGISFSNMAFTAQVGDVIDLRISGPVAGFYNNIAMRDRYIQIQEEISIPEDGVFTLSSILPDITQTEFIKDIAVQYGCVVSTNSENKTVKFDLHRDIEAKKITAVDWTNKLDVTNNVSIDYSAISEGYGKKNYLKYVQNNSEDNGNTDKAPVSEYNARNPELSLGNGRFDIDNDFLTDENTVYTSPFSSTLEDSIGVSMTANGPSQKLMFIPYATKTAINTLGTLSGIEVKLYNLRSPKKGIIIRDVETSVLLSDAVASIVIANEGYTLTNTISDLPFCYFVKGNKVKAITDTNDPLYSVDNVTYNLSYETLPEFNNDKGLLDDYYPSLISLIENGDTISVEMRLTEADIINLDFTQPFRLNTPELNGLFIINKIPKINGFDSSISVELLKV